MPEFVSTARLFIGDVGRHFGVPEDAVNDLKVAVSEACTAAISAQSDGSNNAPVRLAVRPASRGFSVEVSGPAGFLPAAEPAGAASDFGADLGIGLIMALFPDARLNDNFQGATLRLSVAAPGGGTRRL